MTEDQIEMLRWLIKYEIAAAQIDGMEHGVWGYAERQLDEGWKKFQESFTGGETMTELRPSNKFVIPVTVHLSDWDQVQLRKFLNLHYLGDEDANEFVDGSYRAKYPEKETTEFQNAVWQTTVGYTVCLTVEFDVNGKPTFGIADNG